jgi:hypothetical protein
MFLGLYTRTPLKTERGKASGRKGRIKEKEGIGQRKGRDRERKGSRGRKRKVTGVSLYYSGQNYAPGIQRVTGFIAATFL